MATNSRKSIPFIYFNITQIKVDICCFGVGSGGTVVGVSRYLKEQKPSVKIYAVEPFEASVINGFKHAPHKIPGIN